MSELKEDVIITIRLQDGDHERAERIAKKTGWELEDLFRKALSAALDAIEKNNYQIESPINLKVEPLKGNPGGGVSGNESLGGADFPA